MKKTTLILLLALFWHIGYTQDSKLVTYKPQYTVHLKNGKIVNGILLEYVQDEYITIELENHKSVTYKQSEVKKITKSEKLIASKELEQKTEEQDEYYPNSSYLTDKYDHKPSKSRVQLEFGYNFGTHGMYRFNLLGQLFNNNIQRGGIGIGYRRYAIVNDIYFPIFASVKSKLGKYKNGLFVGFDIGYSFSESIIPLGMYLHPNIGFGFQISRINYLQFMIGYDIQKGLDTWLVNNNTSPVSFSAGITF